MSLNALAGAHQTQTELEASGAIKPQDADAQDGTQKSSGVGKILDKIKSKTSSSHSDTNEETHQRNEPGSADGTEGVGERDMEEQEEQIGPAPVSMSTSASTTTTGGPNPGSTSGVGDIAGMRS